MQLTVPPSVTAGHTFNVTVQCGNSTVGKDACASQYQIHFRGPIAYTVPAEQVLYHHNKTTGTTIIECQLGQSGVYEIWAWADWPGRFECPPWQQFVKTSGAVKGSGETTFTVTEGTRALVDNMRQCTLDDYSSPMEGRWVGVDYVKEEYRTLPILQGHFERSSKCQLKASLRSGLLHGRSDMPDYIWLPYQCKRHALNYTQSMKSIKDMKHVAYIGDSVIRSTFCGNLYNQLHNFTVGGDCTHSSDRWVYQRSNKTFEYDTEDERKSIRFTHRFMDDHPEQKVSSIQHILSYGLDVSHVITNLGMWFGAHPEPMYIEAVLAHLEVLYATFGNGPRYTWINTYSVAAAIICQPGMRRSILEHHGDWATIAIRAWKARHPDVRINMIHSHPIVDSRPETSSDGRCV